jgi:hypothetical protein
MKKKLNSSCKKPFYNCVKLNNSIVDITMYDFTIYYLNNSLWYSYIYVYVYIYLITK